MQALGDGLMEVSLARLGETNRPPATQSATHLSAFRLKVAAVLDVLEPMSSAWGTRVEIGQIAVATLMGAGDHVVASGSLYGGSHNLLGYTLKRFGIETTFINPRNLDDWKRAIRPNTRLLFGETLGNPGLDVLDIPAVATIAHEARVPLLVDATFTTPYLMNHFALGADLRFASGPVLS